MDCCSKSCASCEPTPSAGSSSVATRGGTIVASLPAISAALLAPAACPCCWATWAGLTGAGFLSAFAGPWLLPLTAACMLLALGVLGAKARSTGRYGPLLLAVLAAAAVLGGRFALDWRALVIAGALGLFAAAVWSSWPRGQRLQRRSR